MEHHNEINAEHGAVVNREEITTNLDRPPLLSWGAIAGGLVFVVAVFWLFNLLGIALGTSVADASDGEAIANGFSTAAVIWLILSALLAFFIGSLLTARLSGKVDSTAGMLHGMCLWGLATTLMLLASYWGVSGLAHSGYALLTSTTSTASAAVSAATNVLPSSTAISETVASAADSRLADNIKARLKRRAATVLARVETEDGADVTEEEARQAINQIDMETLESVSDHIIAGEMTAAREELANATGLSEEEIGDIVEGIENEFEEQLNMDENETDLVADIRGSLNRQISDYVSSLDAEGGPTVSQSDVREALREMDRQTMQTVASRLLNGDAQGAKDSLAANTSLSARQVNDVVEGVNDDVSRTVARYQQDAEEAVEMVSSYAQAVLWTAFVAGAMGLGVSLLGGWLGAESSRRIAVEVHRQV